MIRLAALPLLIAAALAATPPAQPQALSIDAEHSSVGFSVRHLFTRVHGRFKAFEGTFVFDEANPAASSVRASIRADSVDTDVAARDNDLRSERFFDAAKFPTLEFRSTRVEKAAGARFRVTGDLTMHGVTRPIVLDAEFLGKGKDPWGNLRYGFRATTTVNRKDFGMQWNEAVETGGVLVGDDVEIALDIEGIAGGA